MYIENIFMIYTLHKTTSLTYDHRTLKTRLPVRSALFRHDTGGLVVKWVTISESLLLYVFGTFATLRSTRRALLSPQHAVLLQDTHV